MATLVGLFGGLALLLAAVGLYGVMAYTAGQRRTEIGIRLALGARPSTIVRMIIVEGLRLVAIGAIGTAGALVTSRAVQHQLFGVGPLESGDLCHRRGRAHRRRGHHLYDPCPSRHAR